MNPTDEQLDRRAHELTDEAWPRWKHAEQRWGAFEMATREALAIDRNSLRLLEELKPECWNAMHPLLRGHVEAHITKLKARLGTT